MKCNQSRPGFELVSPCPFPTTITIAPRAHIYAQDTGCNPEDLPEAMNDREKWRERVRDIRAGGTTWWWHLYVIYVLSTSDTYICIHTHTPSMIIQKRRGFFKLKYIRIFSIRVNSAFFGIGYIKNYFNLAEIFVL